MNRGVSRRSLMKAASVGGIGLAGAGLSAQAAASYRRGLLSSGELGSLPRVPEYIRPTDRAALGRDESLRVEAAPALAVRLVELHLTPGEGLAHLGVDVRQGAAEFVCDPRLPNLLLEGVSRLTYEIVEVAWQPGEGWPVYRSRTPLNEPALGTRYAGVPRHQIVLLDDRAVYVGNPGQCGVITNIRGPVRVDVNGTDPAAHRGFYKVVITGVG